MNVKCQYCLKTDTDREEMVKITTLVGKKGNKKNSYYHPECYPKFKEEKDFKNKESDELDKLVKTILEVHEIDSLPQQFFPYIQDLRNGTIIRGRNKKKYKEGYPYSLIAKTYKYKEETIKYWKKRKERDFKGSTMSELKYCWAIINDNISAVKKLEEKKEFLRAKKKEEIKQQQKHDTITHDIVENVKFKKRKREDDISDFL